MRVVLDTNVLISDPVFPGGKPSRIASPARAGAIEAFTSPRLIEELAHVLRDKFSYEDILLEITIRKVASFCQLVYPQEDLIREDERIDGDTHVLECAVEAQADYVVTGDVKHLLPLRRFRATKIVSPADFLIETGL